MTPSQNNPAAGSCGRVTNAWGLRGEGLIMGKGGKVEVHEFTGMWPLKPDADLVAVTKTLAPGGFVKPPGASFSTMTTELGLIRTARWFVARTQDFDGWTLFFISQFESSLEQYFDDFVLTGKENLALIWGQCVGCPTGPDATAHDIVEYIARGQVKTLACYDAFPSLSFGQIQKLADWYEKTQKFQRAVCADGGKLEDKVNEFLNELAKTYKPVPSDAAIDTDVAHQWQYEDVAEYIKEMHVPSA
jgi:hypothetical protein